MEYHFLYTYQSFHALFACADAIPRFLSAYRQIFGRIYATVNIFVETIMQVTNMYMCNEGIVWIFWLGKGFGPGRGWAGE